jgi:beta-aspartyl-dipeptidase (metallo-type)
MLRFSQFLPTHCNRNDYIFEDSKIYAKEGFIDITTSSWPYFKDEEIKPSKALKELIGSGVPLTNITFSSDSCGSLPGFDKSGRLVKLEIGVPSSNMKELSDAVLVEKIPLEKALKVLTSNVASILKLNGKGFLAKGMDADILFLNKGLEIQHLIAMGRWALKNGVTLLKGSYE